MSQIEESPYLPRRSRMRQMVFPKLRLEPRRRDRLIEARSGTPSAQADSASQAPPGDANAGNPRYYNKNAFRYICRIAFKEAASVEYRRIVREVCNKHSIPEDHLLDVFAKAQAISGPRFFQELITDLTPSVSKALIEFLMWFLQKRYLRYLDRGLNPRRRPSNRAEYLKYKNLVMLPMLRNILRQQTQA